ncbi:unnamed protein product [Candida verbasci]|uniref:LIM zinc-binding domain-containing protein n=1 Tax=Candida verbasci TaxID=1227364 RepID=A0A9W4XNK0_9ASCO|nr:unnamed protein product [Candida verbasci]
MASFPTFIRQSEQSPRSLDNAFPPFKVEHRYKGVYERAGFDVNRGGNSKSSDNIKTQHYMNNNQSRVTNNSNYNYTHGNDSKVANNANYGYTHNNDSRTTNNYNYTHNNESKTTNSSSGFYDASSQSFKYNRYEVNNRSNESNNTIKSKTNHSIPRSISSKSSNNSQYNRSNENIQNNSHYNNNQYNRSNENIQNNSHYNNNQYNRSNENIQNNSHYNNNQYNRSNENIQNNSHYNNNQYNNSNENVENNTQFSSSSQSSKKSSLNSNFTNRFNDSKSNSSVTSIFQNTTEDKSITYSENNHENKQRNIKNLTLNLNEEENYNDQLNSSNSSTSRERFDPRRIKRTNNSIRNIIPDSKPCNYHQPQSPKIQYEQMMSNQNQQQIPLPFSDNQVPYSPGYPPRSQNRPQPNLNPYSLLRDNGDKLGNALDEFKNDFKSSKSPPTPATPPDLPNMSPSQIELSKFENNKDSRFSYGNNSNNNVSDQFKQFKNIQVAKDENLNSDYQKFLNIDNDDKKRTSQVSMVSSVLSKDSSSNDEEDEKIEQELERQLESLKISGSEINIDKSSISSNSTNQRDVNKNSISSKSSNDAPVSQNKNCISSVSSNNNPPIPQFTIQDMDKENRISGESNFDEVSIGSIESIKPLSFSQSNVSPTKRIIEEPIEEEPIEEEEEEEEEKEDLNEDEIKPLRTRSIDSIKQKPLQEQYKQLSPPQFQSESVEEEFKPLSPKTHSIEQELQNMNFQIEQTTESPSNFLNQNETFPSGTGPCRSCNQYIDLSVKGKNKAIFSKTGELSGQWHRKCFNCNYQNCDIIFNKNVQVYAFNDKPYCFTHYHILNDSICQSCNIGIEGSCIENDNLQKWHLDCLKCNQCNQRIKNDYYLINDLVYCEFDAKNVMNNKNKISINDKIEKRRTRVYNVNI